jgi:hypothetical protein
MLAARPFLKLGFLFGNGSAAIGFLCADPMLRPAEQCSCSKKKEEKQP